MIIILLYISLYHYNFFLSVSSKKEYTPLVKHVLLYTTLVPLLGSPCLNYPIILNNDIPCVDCIKARHHTSTYIWATSHIYLTLSHMSLYLFIGYPPTIHTLLYVSHLVISDVVDVLDFTRGCFKMWGFVCEMIPYFNMKPW